jgi:hypothetical protein
MFSNLFCHVIHFIFNVNFIIDLGVQCLVAS